MNKNKDLITVGIAITSALIGFIIGIMMPVITPIDQQNIDDAVDIEVKRRAFVNAPRIEIDPNKPEDIEVEVEQLEGETGFPFYFVNITEKEQE